MKQLFWLSLCVAIISFSCFLSIVPSKSLAQEQAVTEHVLTVVPVKKLTAREGGTTYTLYDLWWGYSTKKLDNGNIEGNQRSFLQFTLEELPKGAEIVSASLALSVDSFNNDNLLEIWRINSDWIERDQASWQEYAWLYPGTDKTTFNFPPNDGFFYPELELTAMVTTWQRQRQNNLAGDWLSIMLTGAESPNPPRRTDGSAYRSNCFETLACRYINQKPQLKITYRASSRLTGAVGGTYCSSIQGWACDQTNPGEPVLVDLYANNGSGEKLVGTTTANLSPLNADDATAITQACGGASDKRFGFALPKQFADGTPLYAASTTTLQLSVKARSLRTPEGQQPVPVTLSGSPKTLTAESCRGIEAVELSPSDDAGLAQQNPTHDPYLTAGYQRSRGNNDGASTRMRRTALKFDLSSIPSNAELRAATLRLYSVTQRTKVPSVMLSLVNTNWSEQSITWEGHQEALFPLRNTTRLDLGYQEQDKSQFTSFNVLPLLQNWKQSTDANINRDGKLSFLIQGIDEANQDSGNIVFFSKECPNSDISKCDYANMVPQLTVAYARPPELPKGAQGSTYCSAVTGWSCDPDKFDQALPIEIYADNGTGPKRVATTSANLAANSPEDATAIGNICGNHSNKRFRLAVPQTFADGTSIFNASGQSQISVRALDVDAAGAVLSTFTTLPGGPITINRTGCAQLSDREKLDIDGDGRITIYDYNKLLSEFGTNSTGRSDINRDNKVDQLDVDWFVQKFPENT